METSFSRLVRFVDEDNNICYGEAPAMNDPADLLGEMVPIYDGTIPWDRSLRLTNVTRQVKNILPPLADIPAILCIGLNYRRHIEETKSQIPEFPTLFTKPRGTLTGALEDIKVHQEALWLDYEGELCFVIGKTCKDVGPDENPLEYVLGYAIGNDVSSRYWQMPERSGGQAGYAKGFDKFCPLGPYICSAKIVTNAGNLQLTTKVNGEVRQDESTSDLLFTIADLIRFASRGHTIEPGTVFMTGTPSGVALGMKPPIWLKDGDVVEVKIEGLGLVRNRYIVPQ